MQSHRTMRVHTEARVASPRSPRPPTSALHSRAPLAFDNAEHKRESDEAWGSSRSTVPRILNALAVEQDRNSGKYQPGAAACCNSYLDLNDCALARWCTPSGSPSVAMTPWASV
jgi:hypothetical protein